MATKKRTPTEKKTCDKCKKPYALNSFYKTNSAFSVDGKTNICKKCIRDMVNEDKIDTVYEVLQLMDLPFISDVWQRATQYNGSIFGKYVTMINSLPQYASYTYKDSEHLKSNQPKQTNKEENISNDYEDNLDDFTVTPEIKNRWRGKYTPSQLRDLEKFYNDMRMTHTIVTPQHIKSLIMMCKMQLKMDQFLEDNDMNSFSKLHDQYQKLLQSSGLRPIDKVGGDEATGMRSFSHIFEEVEKNGFIKPVSITENQDIVDKTIQYIMNYTLRLLNKQVLTQPPVDTPKVADIDG